MGNIFSLYFVVSHAGKADARGARQVRVVDEVVCNHWHCIALEAKFENSITVLFFLTPTDKNASQN